MGSIITLGLHYLKLLFKSKSLLLILFLVPISISALVTCGLQSTYMPTVNYLKNKKSEEESIKFVSKKALEAGELFKKESKFYPMVKEQLDKGVNRDVPEVAQIATQNFFSVLLPAYYPLVGNLVNTSMVSLNTIILIILSISWLPAMFGVFLMNQDKKNQTLIPIIAQGVSSNQFLLSKLLAGFIISFLITLASLTGYFVGAFCASKLINGDISINANIIQDLGMIGIIGSFCAISLTILLSQIIIDNKAQIIICGMLVPLLVITIFMSSIKGPMFDSSITEIQAQIAKVKTERIPLDKKVYDLLAERQIYDNAQIFAVKLGSDLIPNALKSIPKTNKSAFSDSMFKALNTFSITLLISIILSMLLSLFRFRKQ